MFANFTKYLFFIFKRERVMSTVWVAALTAFTVFIGAVYPGMFSSEEALQSMASTMNTPAMTAMMGPVYGLESLTTSMVMAQECLVWISIAVILMNIFFINRYTRADEELGRLEMLTALPVGRLTNGAAAVIFSFALNVLIALLTAVSLIIINMDGTSVRGALVYGLSIGMQGFVFAALTLLTAQLFSTARGSTGAAVALMGLAYIMRAQGDMAGNDLSVISPMGLGLKVQAFYTSDFWPVLVLFIEAFIIACAALLINGRRDIGMGVFPARKGRAEASRFFRSPFGFAWRLSRGNFLAWAVGVFAIGLTYGAVTGELETFVSGNEMMSQVIGGAGDKLADAYITLLSGIMALIMSVPVINCVNRIYTEEKRGRIEQILAAAVPRVKLYGSFILIALLEAALLPVICSVGFFAAAQSSGLVEFKTVLFASAAYIPAIFVTAGLSALLAGCVPKLSALVWVLFGGSFMLFYFGRIIEMPDWVLKLTPFGNTPQYPMQELTANPLILMSAIAAALVLLGGIGYRKRDIR